MKWILITGLLFQLMSYPSGISDGLPGSDNRLSEQSDCFNTDDAILAPYSPVLIGLIPVHAGLNHQLSCYKIPEFNKRQSESPASNHYVAAINLLISQSFIHACRCIVASISIPVIIFPFNTFW